MKHPQKSKLLLENITFLPSHFRLIRLNLLKSEDAKNEKAVANATKKFEDLYEQPLSQKSNFLFAIEFYF